MKAFTSLLVLLVLTILSTLVVNAEEEKAAAPDVSVADDDIVVEDEQETTAAPVEGVGDEKVDNEVDDEKEEKSDVVEEEEVVELEEAVEEESVILEEEEVVLEDTTTTIEGAENTTAASTQGAEEAAKATEGQMPVQSGPYIDLLGETLLSLEVLNESQAQFKEHYTNEILDGKKVVGLYFSADWCGPCRKFTPELVTFYDKINSKRRKKDFEIVWISRCRDVQSFGQYFTHMKWLAMPPAEAMGQRGQMLSNKYKVKGIPSLVLLDEVGNVITTDARNKIPMDRAGVGFPWRNPIATLYMTLFPKSLRLMIKSQILEAKAKVLRRVKSMLPGRGAAPLPVSA